jgi:uncharacterized protein
MIALFIIEKPIDVFERDRAWEDLVRFVESPTARLGVVYGRRRLGKTHLVENLARASGGLYFCAAQQSAVANLGDLSTTVSEWLGASSLVRYRTWDEALDHLLHLASAPAVLVFDEIAYLIEHLPSFPSLLQRALDRQPRPTTRVLLSGSTQGVMRSLTGSGQPLRGRASLELVLAPFSFRTTAAFWQVPTSSLAIMLWSVVGGTPGYRELCDNEAPASDRDFPSWLTHHILSPSAALYREGRVVVLEEAAFTDPVNHWAVLSAISGGAQTRIAISEATGRPSTSLSNSLTVLAASGLVSRDEDPLHGRRSTYRITEPIVATWKELVEPIERRVIDGDPQRLFDDIEAPLHSRVIGPAFEQLVRDWVEHDASRETVGGRVTAVGSSMLGRSALGTNAAQIDVVAVERHPSGRQTVLAIGEAKHRNRPAGLAQVRRLEELRDRLGDPSIKLIVACDGGFDRDLVRLGRDRSDVELIDADRLLSGD